MLDPVQLLEYETSLLPADKDPLYNFFGDSLENTLKSWSFSC